MIQSLTHRTPFRLFLVFFLWYWPCLSLFRIFWPKFDITYSYRGCAEGCSRFLRSGFDITYSQRLFFKTRLVKTRGKYLQLYWFYRILTSIFLMYITCSPQVPGCMPAATWDFCMLCLWKKFWFSNTIAPRCRVSCPQRLGTFFREIFNSKYGWPQIPS